MQIKFRDFYSQYVEITDETASGNVRMKVRTMPSLNDVQLIKEADMQIETDISLDRKQVRLLHSVLTAMMDDEE